MKKFYYAVATSNFECGDKIHLTEMIADKLRQQGITNVSVNRYGELFKQFADGFKLVREEEIQDKELDWSFFPSSKIIITEIILDTMAFYREGNAAWVRIIKHTKPNLDVMYLISVVDE